MSKCPFLLSFFVVVGVELCTAWVAPLLCGAVSAYDLVDGVCGMGSIFLNLKILLYFIVQSKSFRACGCCVSGRMKS